MRKGLFKQSKYARETQLTIDECFLFFFYFDKVVDKKRDMERERARRKNINFIYIYIKEKGSRENGG